jgi:signal transduction histidine kinase
LVESTPGKGSKFVIILPVPNELAEQAKGVPA